MTWGLSLVTSAWRVTSKDWTDSRTSTADQQRHYSKTVTSIVHIGYLVYSANTCMSMYEQTHVQASNVAVTKQVDDDHGHKVHRHGVSKMCWPVSARSMSWEVNLWGGFCSNPISSTATGPITVGIGGLHTVGHDQCAKPTAWSVMYICTSKLSCLLKNHDLCQHNKTFGTLLHPPYSWNSRDTPRDLVASTYMWWCILQQDAPEGLQGSCY